MTLGSDDPRPFGRVVWPAAVTGAVVALFLGVLFDLVVAPTISPILEVLQDTVAFGVVLLLMLSFQMAAGMVCARAVRSRRPVHRRTEVLATAVVAGLLGCLLYQGLAIGAAWAMGTPWWSWRYLVEPLRWAAQVALGALLVDPDPQAVPTDRFRSGMTMRGGPL